MGTIQKRADELRPGDVIVIKAPGGTVAPAVDQRLAVLYTFSSAAIQGGDLITVHAVDLGGAQYMPGILIQAPRAFSADQLLYVESPDLTPAQQHAEELAEALRVMMDCHDSGAELYHDYHAKYTTLLDKIKPPEPPTLAEALELVRKVHDTTPCGHKPELAAMLDRARRAGMLTDGSKK